MIAGFFSLFYLEKLEIKIKNFNDDTCLQLNAEQEAHFPQTYTHPGFPTTEDVNKKKKKKGKPLKGKSLCLWLYRCNRGVGDWFSCTPFHCLYLGIQ